MTNEKFIIIKLTLYTKCKKNKACFKIQITKKIINFITFLWQIKLIYGYFLQTKKNVIVFLNNQQPLLMNFNLIEKNVNKNYVKKQKKWLKNSIFIIKRHTTYLKLNSFNKKALGGFLIAKIC